LPVRAVLLVILASVLFGTTGTSQTFAPDGAASISIGAARMSFGGTLMALVGLINWRRRGRREKPAASTPPSGQDGPGPRGSESGNAHPRWQVALCLLGAAAGMALYQVTFFAGTRANGVAIGTIVTLGSAPLVAGLAEWVFRHVRPGKAWFAATALAIVGLVLLTGTSGTVDLGGAALSLTAGAAYAVELVLLKIPLDRGWPSSDAVSWVMGLAALLSVPVLLTTDLAWLATPNGIAVEAWLAVATIVVAYQVLGLGLIKLPASTVSTLTLAEPTTATLLGVFLLHETLTPPALAGIALIAVGLVILARASGREG
jgi:DME family drug/metabolite transporter